MTHARWLQLFRLASKKRGPPKSRKEREAIAARMRREAFGPITDDQRAKDKQLLADAHAGRGSLI